MRLAARLKDGGLHLLPERRVIRAAEVEALLDARGIVEDAMMEAERIRESAHQAYLEEKARGHADGIASGREKVADELVGMAAQGSAFIDRLEARMPEIITGALRQILGRFEDTDLVVWTARQALRLFRKETAVSLRVAPTQLEAVRARLDELRRGNESITYIDVVADSGLTANGCVLESELGSIDAGIEAQLAVIERTLQAQIAGGKG